MLRFNRRYFVIFHPDFRLGLSLMRYLAICLSLCLFAGCGESQYERCLKVEKDKVVEHWDDFDQVAKRLLRSFEFSLDLQGVPDQEISSPEIIKSLKESLQVLADLPLSDIRKNLVKSQGADSVAVSGYESVVEAWKKYLEFAQDSSLAPEHADYVERAVDQVIISYDYSDSFSNLYYFGVPDEIMLKAQYEAVEAIEKSNEEAINKLNQIQNEIASNICNSRGLY